MTILLVIIYLSFISLGLPDALLGSAWPVIHGELGVPLSYGGILSMVVTAGTIISSMLSARMIRKFGTGPVTAVSVTMTAAALLGFSLSGQFWVLCLLGIPLGLGAGAVDAALNNFVALHYKAHHMSWLHCFWGVGATAGPYIMSMFLAGQGGWQQGYRTVGILQAVLVVVLFSTLFLWKGAKNSAEQEHAESKILSLKEIFLLPNAKETLLSFFCYCSIEMTTGLWGASFLVLSKGLSAQTAALWVSFYYLGITAGRFISGFLSMRLNGTRMVRIGLGLITTGILLLWLAPVNILLLPGFVLIGLGCAPIFPSLLHDTPRRFGTQNAQSLMGVQMAFAYIGSTVMPPLFGLLAQGISTALFPVFLLVILILFVFVTERVNHNLAKSKKTI